ncbi:hypothetical protein GCM10028820_13650 [Tessaracoccus terricola]
MADSHVPKVGLWVSFALSMAGESPGVFPANGAMCAHWERLQARRLRRVLGYQGSVPARPSRRGSVGGHAVAAAIREPLLSCWAVSVRGPGRGYGNTAVP